MVVAQEKLAAQIGADILRQGGNAVDAAVATGFALAVTYPRAGNIGGGGFMVIHSAERNEDIAIDYRETAPAAITRDIFLGADGKPDADKSRNSALGIGVPGTVAGLALALEKYGSGKFTLAQILKPAIELARDGFVVADDMADTLAGHVSPDGALAEFGQRLFPRRWHSAARWRPADPDRSRGNAAAIAEQGPRGFYEGPVAEKLAKAVNDAGGIMTPDDLKSYQAVIRAPVRGNYRGYDIVSMPLPSSGGTVLLEIVEHPRRLSDVRHEAGLRAIAACHDRGDEARLCRPRALSRRSRFRQRADADPARQGLRRQDSAPASILPARHQRPLPCCRAPREGSNTTHYSVVDSHGNAVSNTYTLNFPYGVGLVAEGTGVLLNNELDDFTAAPGASNAFGLVGFEANLPGPGKRPLSSMSPTIVLKDGKPVLVTGTPGGSRIISAVLQIVVNVIDYKMDVAAAVAAPRVHHQWMPDVVRVERGFPQETLDALRARGPRGGRTARPNLGQFDRRTPNGLLGAPDPRTRGAEAAGQ